jgi:hypothetical protein
MKLTLLSLLTLAAASPIVEKRAFVTNYVHVTKYVYQNEHIFVDQNGNPISTSYELVSTGGPEAPTTSTIVAGPTTTSDASYAPQHSHSSDPLPAPASIVLNSSPPAPALAILTSSEAPAPAVTTSSSSTPPSTPTPTPDPVSSTAPPPPAPVPVTTSSAAPPPPAPASSSAPAAAAPAESPSSGSGSGSISGQATFYAPGLGACGITNTASDMIAALNAPQFGSYTNSNDDPNCGKQAQVFYNGKSVTVTITDRCPACAYGSLDLSPAAFNQLADPALGRIDITWNWL